jgi:uncharacterized membrane protein YqhA
VIVGGETSVIRRVLASSRWFIAAAVVGTFFSAVGLLLYGTITVFAILWNVIEDHDFTEKGSKELAVQFIGMVDLFLLGTVLYIVALGLYELFIDEHLPLPGWLQIATLDDLKAKLIGVIVVLLAVSFLGQVVTRNGGDDVFYLGAGVALVIAALALSTYASADRRH